MYYTIASKSENLFSSMSELNEMQNSIETNEVTASSEERQNLLAKIDVVRRHIREEADDVAVEAMNNLMQNLRTVIHSLTDLIYAKAARGENSKPMLKFQGIITNVLKNLAINGDEDNDRDKDGFRDDADLSFLKDTEDEDVDKIVKKALEGSKDVLDDKNDSDDEDLDEDEGEDENYDENEDENEDEDLEENKKKNNSEEDSEENDLGDDTESDNPDVDTNENNSEDYEDSDDNLDEEDNETNDSEEPEDEGKKKSSSEEYSDFMSNLLSNDKDIGVNTTKEKKHKRSLRDDLAKKLNKSDEEEDKSEKEEEEDKEDTEKEQNNNEEESEAEASVAEENEEVAKNTHEKIKYLGLVRFKHNGKIRLKCSYKENVNTTDYWYFALADHTVYKSIYYLDEKLKSLFKRINGENLVSKKIVRLVNSDTLVLVKRKIETKEKTSSSWYIGNIVDLKTDDNEDPLYSIPIILDGHTNYMLPDEEMSLKEIKAFRKLLCSICQSNIYGHSCDINTEDYKIIYTLLNEFVKKNHQFRGLKPKFHIAKLIPSRLSYLIN